MSAVEAVIPPADNNNHTEESDDISESTDVASVTIGPDSVLNKSFPLANTWHFWFLDANKQMEWLDRLHDVCVINTVEAFWALTDRIRPASVMLVCDYALFRKGINPVWEVPENKEGGRLVLMVAKNEMDALNELWERLLVALIGNRFGEHTASVCGAVCNIRQKGSKITLWTSKCSDVETNKAIGQILREVWQESHPKFIEKRKIKYESHEDAQNKQSSATPHKFEC